MVRAQASTMSEHFRSCRHCRLNLSSKGYRWMTFRSLFGDVPLRVQRFRRLPMSGPTGGPKSFSALALEGGVAPRRLFRRSGADGLLERVHVVVPELALVHVGRRRLPVLLGPLKPLQEAPLLFLTREVQDELEDDRPLPGEVILEMRDVRETLVPNLFANEFWGQRLPLQDPSCTRTTRTSS